MIRKQTLVVPAQLRLIVEYASDARGNILILSTRLAGSMINVIDVLSGEDSAAIMAEALAEIEGYEADMRQRAEVDALDKLFEEQRQRKEQQQEEVADKGVVPL